MYRRRRFFFRPGTHRRPYQVRYLHYGARRRPHDRRIGHPILAFGWRRRHENEGEGADRAAHIGARPPLPHVIHSKQRRAVGV